MAFLSITERLQADEVLPSAVRAALGLTDPASVYFGVRERSVRQGAEVCVEELATDFIGLGGPSQVHEHQHRMRVLLRSTTDAKRTGVDQQRTRARLCGQLRAMFNGMRPFAAALPDVLYHRAEIIATDADPEKTGVLEGVVLLRTYSTGDGSAAQGLGQPVGGPIGDTP